MDQIPSDILNRIFIQVPFNQKKVCRLVCKLWDSIISNRCLYHTLEIENEEHFYKLLDIMDGKPLLKTQVINLALLEWNSSAKSKVIEYFPNLQEFSVSSTFQETIDFNESETTASKDRMRSIRDNGNCLLLVDLSKHRPCHRLTKVSVSHFLPAFVLPVLKNMPALKTLILEQSRITIAQLEMIHTDIPTLQTITVYLDHLGDPFPTIVTPATSITTLYADVDYVVKDEQLNWFRYVTEKYPRLENYDLVAENKGFQLVDNDEVFNYIYGVLYIPFLKKLGPQLKYLNLTGAQFNNYKVFEKLDEFRCQIKKIKIKSDDNCTWKSSLSSSNQPHYIEELDINRVKSTSFDWIRNMKVLNSLKINFHRSYSQRVDLNAFFESCPRTVKSIDFNYADHYDLNHVGFGNSYTVERIELSSGQIPADFDIFISKCLPNLHHLYIDGHLQFDIKMFLPHHHFSYIGLCFLQNGEYNVSVTILRNSKRKYFRPRDKNTYVEVSRYEDFIKSVSEESLNRQPFVELTFASVRKLVLDYREAMLN